RIVLVCDGEIIGEHPRCFDRGRTLYNPWHYVAALERKPGALRNGAPFKDWNLPASLTRLRERGMASALEESLTALSQKKLAPTSWLGQLLQAEIADRQARSYQYQLRLARFPMPRDLDSFDFRESAVNETQIRQLHTGEYLSTARNIVLVGGTGTGKTHLATALARQVILQGKRARFYSVVDL